MTATAYVKKLDAANLQRILRCDPPRIQAEEATPEAIESCRLLGVELLLAPGKPAGRKPNKRCDCGGCQSGFERASPEEAEKILGNTRIKILLNPDGRGGFMYAGDPASNGAPSKKPYFIILDEFACFPFTDMLFHTFATGSTRQGMSEAPETSDADGNSVWHVLSRPLVEAGYIPGQSYEQCLEMAKWHPGMAEFMTKQLPGGVGSDIHRQQFGYAQMGASQASVASVGGEPASGRVTGRGVFSANAKALKAAGYIKGQTLEHCLEMAKWHPAMQAVMRSLGAFSDDRVTDLDRQFSYVKAYLEDGGYLG
jgi:hypothetical protein